MYSIATICKFCAGTGCRVCTSGQDSGQAVGIGQVGVLDAACTSVIAAATPPVPVARSTTPSRPWLLPRHAFGVAIVDASADAGCLTL